MPCPSIPFFLSIAGADDRHTFTSLSSAHAHPEEAGMLTAADVMTTGVVTVRPETSIHEIAKLLCDHHISGVPVSGGDEQLLGIVSEGDLIGHARLAGDQRRSWW